MSMRRQYELHNKLRKMHWLLGKKSYLTLQTSMFYTQKFVNQSELMEFIFEAVPNVVQTIQRF